MILKLMFALCIDRMWSCS